MNWGPWGRDGMVGGKHTMRSTYLLPAPAPVLVEI